MPRRHRIAAWGLVCLGAALMFTSWSAPRAQGDESGAPVLRIEGVINPLTERYLARELSRAVERQRPFVVVELDTPGGTMDAMRGMVQVLLGSPIPVVVYVAPSGARAASAGVFITAAAHVAAMAPGTNIGAAHPVALGGGGDVSASKAVQDAAALARAIADARDRDAAWLERAVRESVSLTATEAYAQNVIDLVAESRSSLLAQLDGRLVRTAAGQETMWTNGVQLVPRPMSLAERILHALTDPQIAYLLFTLGLIGIAAELYSPGAIFPGVTGALSLVLALVAFGSLPLNGAGLLLVVAGVVIVVIDLLVGGLGVLSAGGLVAFVLGSLMLYRPFDGPTPAMSALHVSPWLVVGMGAVFATLVLGVARGVLRARSLPVRTGSDALLGKEGVATSELAPQGTVQVEGEPWTARSETESIHPGEPVRVVGIEGVTLRVVREATVGG